MKNKKLSLLLILPLLVTACNKTPTGSSPNNSGPVVCHHLMEVHRL